MGEEPLAKTILIYQANTDISGAEVISSCNPQTQFLESYRGLYFFEVDYSSDTTCRNGNTLLKFSDQRLLSTLSTLKIFSEVQKLEYFLDHSDDDLKNLLALSRQALQKNALYKNYTGKNLSEYFRFARGQRLYLESQYKAEMIAEIL